ncbi:Uracil-DNA glycosylase [Thermococcus onnurineus NA1]|uniref:Type-4 uracil-DNA glycosylase n=2 Tax=Thermococcus TaxID=2263 RepID=B6YTR7_THEON|nr:MULTISPECIES: type-4 uracil-DNA glycosylase [Thermococcus]ACJ17008.1 Uracil-DNA glycosylase [Thermococcus onnurineus NA1]NJE46654.1 uracil-DNA glycosylase [Thermococcus sp. GR7]NJE77918.1 uracil-DNA glycosylase [Thermococcus sp. GR4]NJF23046.1 uracil-DNA glycosylase [Thermococcus sp. GR5]
MGKEELMNKLEEKIKSCRKCPLGELRTNAVPGSGSYNAKVMFVGEAPGYWEDQKGLPFVGRAGKVLDELLAEIGLDRDEVYITNIVKCRPPDNRDPTEDEIKACSPYLDRQIDIIRPKVIVPLGRHSMRYILEKFGFEVEPISKIHGKAFEAHTLFGKIVIMPMYHPAVALYRPALKEELRKDFQKLRELTGESL